MEWQTVVVSLSGSAISGSLAAGLINFLIERKKAQQSKELQETQNAFSVGATSHMATVAFNKHICFCEAYGKEVSKALQSLAHETTSEEPLDVGSLSRIRQDWALWLTNEIDSWLEQYERRITQLGGEAPSYDAEGDRVRNDSGVRMAIAFLRGVLHTEELTALRNELIVGSSRRTPPLG
jgi:hypothetical protein